METFRISQEAVGLAFQQQLEQALHHPLKGKRKSEFRRLKTILVATRVIPSDFDVYTISWGVDKNGAQTIIVTGEDKQPAAVAGSSQ